MQIDWFTLVAQIINFLILLWLLQRFLYGPILRIMEAREDQLVEKFAEATEKSEAAEEEREQLRATRAELDAQRDKLIQEAREEAAERRRTLIQEAREEADAQMERWHESIAREKQTFLREAQTRMGDQLMHLLEQALSDLAGKEVENAIVDSFLERVAEIDGADDLEKDAQAADAQKSGPVCVRTTFELSGELKDRVRAALAPWAAEMDAEVQFEQAPELICGIEVEVRNRRIAWSMRDYLSGLEKQLDEAIFQTSLTQARAEHPEDEASEILPG